MEIVCHLFVPLTQNINQIMMKPELDHLAVNKKNLYCVSGP